MDKLFTSESVSEGHPDKIADQISDTILDSMINKDNLSHVACETFITNGMVLVGGEIKTNADVDIDNLVRNTLKKIGYDKDELGFNGNTCAVINVLGKQSVDISDSIDKGEKQNAGDQGSVFGYAINETETLMPLPFFYANKLIEQHSITRRENKIDLLYPDAKSQITFSYKNGKPHKAKSVVFSTHHNKIMKSKDIVEIVMEEIIKKTIPIDFIDRDTKYYINESGRFTIGGPVGDCGLTGRKIIVDTYGGFAKHGGGAFSGKDPSKIDRSAAYMARYLAKSIVFANICKECEIQISYVIGRSDPLSISVNTFRENTSQEEKLCSIIKRNFDLSPMGIINFLQLLNPIYAITSFHGHFGRAGASFTWENVDKNNIFLNM